MTATGFDVYTWTLTSPDGSARLEWNGAGASIFVDTLPFEAAGLNPEKLEHWDSENRVYRPWPSYPFRSPRWYEDRTASSDMRALIGANRRTLGYHSEMEHYNINLGSGAFFEWAKNMSANDKDIVFVLDPAPFIAAGVDPNGVDGWVFAKVTMDIDGKPTEVDKFLKAFNLK